MAEFVQLFISNPFIPTLTIKVRPSERLHSLLTTVCESIPDEDCSNLKLFHIDSCRWLPTSQEDTVFSFDLMLGGHFELRSPMRHARIRFLDDSTKTMKVDETKKVTELVQDICSQLDITSPEELCIVVAGDYEAPGKTPRKPSLGSPFGSLRSPRAASFYADTAATLSRANSQPSSPSAIGTPPANRRIPPGSPTSTSKRLTLGRPISPVTLTPDRGTSPIASTIARSPSARRRAFSPNVKESPLLDSKRSHTISAGARDSPSLMRASAAKAVVKAAKMRKHFSKKHGLRLNTPWLAPDLSLFDQGVTEEDDLLLMFRHFYWTSLEKGTRRVDLLFMQAKAFFLSGEINCSDIKVAQFAAILCQCQHGDNNDEKFTTEWMQKLWQTLLPAKYKAKESMIQQVLQEHKSLKGVTPPEAKCLLVQLWSTTPTFGYEFFSCAEVRSEKRGLIGVSKTTFVFIPHDAKGDEKKSVKFDFSKLESWVHTNDTDIIRLTFPKTTLQLLLPEYSGVLADSITDHQKLRDVFTSVPGGLDSEYNVMKSDHDSLSPAASRLQLAIPQVTMERDKTLTFDDVYWTEKIGNPIVTEQEAQNISNEGLWHNPVYAHMEELVDERFDFLNNLEGGEDDDVDAGENPPGSAASSSPRVGGYVTGQPSSVRSRQQGGILSPPMQAPLSSQVADFVSSNDTSSLTASGTGNIAATAAPSAIDESRDKAPKTNKKKKKKKEKGVTKKVDPPTLGEMLSKFGVKDTYSSSGSEDDEEECSNQSGRMSPAGGCCTPKIVVEDMSLGASGATGSTPSLTENGLSASSADLADALWG